jgi:glycosyltransferase involved in cell wall biosynthesis
MKILVVHNRYRLPGGEDEVVDREVALLRSHGHAVHSYEKSNADLCAGSGLQRALSAARAIWSPITLREMRGAISAARPDVVHVHNSFAVISPSLYSVCHRSGVPVVQSLHNPRLLCPAATLCRNGSVCERCVGRRVAWPGILRGCYQNSRAHTLICAAVMALHRRMATLDGPIARYITFTEFYRRKFIACGLPAAKLVVKPHFVDPDPGRATGPGTYALFVGRLAPEKGVQTLLDAWRLLGGKVPLKVRGEGPMAPEVRLATTTAPIELLGRLSRQELTELIRGARFLIWPSQGNYESFGLVAIEAFACGVPVLCSRTGAMTEVVADGVTGRHFTPGDPGDLAAKVEAAWNDSDGIRRMGLAARRTFEQKYTAEENCRSLLEIYRCAMAS